MSGSIELHSLSHCRMPIVCPTATCWALPPGNQQFSWETGEAGHLRSTVRGCVAFLLLPQQITTILLALNITNLLSHNSVGQKSVGLRSRCQQAVFPLEALGENLFLCFIQFLEAAHIPWHMTFFLCTDRHQFSIFSSLFESDTPASS